MSAPNKDLGPASVIWDPSGANVELNPTFGTVSFKDELTHVEVREDGHGETAVDAVPTGRKVELTVPMTRSSLTQLEAAIQGSVAGASNLKVSNLVGGAVFANAKEIVVKPLVNNVASVTTSEWLHIHRAYPFVALEWTYDNSGQRITNVVFQAYPDDTSGQVGEIWRMGPA